MTTSVLIGNGPKGSFTTFAEPPVISKWIADGYLCPGCKYNPQIPHVTSLCA